MDRGALLTQPQPSPRAPRWSLWRTVALAQFQRATLGDELPVARALDDAFLRLVSAGDADAEVAGLSAIAHWEAAVAQASH